MHWVPEDSRRKTGEAKVHSKTWKRLESAGIEPTRSPVTVRDGDFSSHDALRGTLSVSKYADTPQFRGGNPYFFSEDPYQFVPFIYASMYRENVHAIHIAMQFAKKSRHCVIKIDSQQQRTKIGASFHVVRQSD